MRKDVRQVRVFFSLSCRSCDSRFGPRADLRPVLWPFDENRPDYLRRHQRQRDFPSPRLPFQWKFEELTNAFLHRSRRSPARPASSRRRSTIDVNSKPYPCTACGKSFARSDVLARHRIRCSAGCLRTSSTSAQLPKREETEEVKPAIFAPFSSIASSLSVDNEPSVSVGSLSEQVGGSLDETGLAVGSDQWGRLTGEVGLRVEAAGTRPYADQRWQDDGLPLGLDLTSTWLNEARITPPSTRPTTPFASGQRLHPSSLTWALSRSASGVDSLGPEWKMMVSNRELKDLKSGVGSYRTVRGDPYWIDLTLFRWTYGGA